MSKSELDFETIGRKIRERRKSLEIKQEYLAEKLGVNPSHISNIECGRVHPSLTILVKIANILNCSVDYFIGGEYTYKKGKDTSPEKAILDKLQYKDKSTKDKILKIIDIL